jgi:hypothetical protein
MLHEKLNYFENETFECFLLFNIRTFIGKRQDAIYKDIHTARRFAVGRLFFRNAWSGFLPVSVNTATKGTKG